MTTHEKRRWATGWRFGVLALLAMAGSLVLFLLPKGTVANHVTGSGNALLESITVSTGTLMPNFAPERTSYRVELSSGSTIIPTVDAVTMSSEATLQIDDTGVVPGSSTITVTAANGNERAYRVYFYREGDELSSNNYLSSLTLSTGTLMPAFSSGTLIYEAQVSSGTTMVPTVTATADDDDAHVSIDEPEVIPGITTVTVTAANGDERVYRIGFYREGENPPVMNTNGNTNANGNGNSNTSTGVVVTPTSPYTGGGGGFGGNGNTGSANVNANVNINVNAGPRANDNSGGVTPSGTNTNTNRRPTDRPGVTLAGTVFTDISGHWGADYMSKLISRCTLTGYMDPNGVALGLFAPDNTITRAELAQMMAKCDGMVLTQVFVAPFTDVRVDDWFASAVAAVKARGWIEGYAGGDFRPNTQINRAEALKLVLASAFADAEIAGSTDFFTDVPGNSWYGRFVAFARARGFVSGYKDANGNDLGRFNPGGNLTRAEAAKLIVLIRGY